MFTWPPHCRRAEAARVERTRTPALRRSRHDRHSPSSCCLRRQIRQPTTCWRAASAMRRPTIGYARWRPGTTPTSTPPSSTTTSRLHRLRHPHERPYRAVHRLQRSRLGARLATLPACRQGGRLPSRPLSGQVHEDRRRTRCDRGRFGAVHAPTARTAPPRLLRRTWFTSSPCSPVNHLAARTPMPSCTGRERRRRSMSAATLRASSPAP